MRNFLALLIPLLFISPFVLAACTPGSCKYYSCNSKVVCDSSGRWGTVVGSESNPKPCCPSQADGNDDICNHNFCSAYQGWSKCSCTSGSGGGGTGGGTGTGGGPAGGTGTGGSLFAGLGGSSLFMIILGILGVIALVIFLW
ncbi:hypothetical protein A3K63_05465 [Candidatus Micrarchaeota archaeon RBG_16_49_10]|nr:MAG: hypothetical protein A3K63_05465 [Candidatus Micrarchaeota archaeon RBG_16_49_10]